MSDNDMNEGKLDEPNVSEIDAESRLNLILKVPQPNKRMKLVILKIVC